MNPFNKKHTLLFLTLFLVACIGPNDNYIRKYFAQPKADEFTVEKIKNLDYLGSKLTSKGVNFNVYSKNATRIELLIFDNPDSKHASYTFEMSRFHNVWSVYVEGIGEGTYYGYRAWGPNWPYKGEWYPGSLAGFKADVDEKGNRFNPNKLLQDPYARAFHRDHDWSKGKAASGPYRQESTIAAAGKSIVVKDDSYKWSSAEKTYWEKRQNGDFRKQNEIIVYEVHLKGFTMNPGSGVSSPGTYRGVGEKAAYFAELGITAVEFLPIHEKPVDGGYWGYWTTGFFAPENTYANNSKKAAHIDEFKWMVEQLHAHDIEVWLDVVYNHTGEGGLWREKVPNKTIVDPNDPADFWSYDPFETATIYSFRGLDNSEYYQLPYHLNPADTAKRYWETTGVGNGWRANNKPGERLILDSLRYWVEEMHVDGFRFDLAAQLGEQDLNYTSWSANTVLQKIVDDPVFQKYNTRMVAEPWDISNYKVGDFPVASNFDSSKFGWFEWNDNFKKLTRMFTNDDSKKLNENSNGIDVAGALTGSKAKFGEGTCPSSCDPRSPYASVNFVAAHDGFTLYDLLSYNEKRNGVGPLNPDGTDVNSGDNNNLSRNWNTGNTPAAEKFKRQIFRSVATFQMIAHGTPMILGGDEWMRTQLGNNNAYTTGGDNTYNWFRWGEWSQDTYRLKMFDFYKKIIQFRKDHCYAFCRTSFEKDDGSAEDMFSWRKPGNTTADATTFSNKAIGLHYSNTGAEKQLYIAINYETGDVNFTLPSGIDWHRKVDTQSFYEGSSGSTSGNIFSDTTVFNGGSTYSVKSRSIVIFKQVP